MTKLKKKTTELCIKKSFFFKFHMTWWIVIIAFLIIYLISFYEHWCEDFRSPGTLNFKQLLEL